MSFFEGVIKYRKIYSFFSCLLDVNPAVEIRIRFKRREF